MTLAYSVLITSSPFSKLARREKSYLLASPYGAMPMTLNSPSSISKPRNSVIAPYRPPSESGSKNSLILWILPFSP
ncbi:hypothetical protein D3C76_1798870 [compost metagenome]